MNKVLTISIAAYNMEKFIKKALDSVTNTALIDDLEIFIIDDGGTDSTMKIARTYQQKFPQSINLVHKENGGWGSTVNYSISQATGKYFKILDGDDFFDSECLENVIKFLKNCNSDAVCMPFKQFIDGKNDFTIVPLPKNEISKNEMPIAGNENSIAYSMHALTFRTDILKRNDIQLLRNCFYTDAEFVGKCLSVSDSIALFYEPLYCYRLGLAEQSCSINGFRKHYKDHQRVFDEMLRYQKQLSAEKRLINICVEYTICHLINLHYYIYLVLESKSEAKKMFWEFNDFLKQNEPSLFDNPYLRNGIRFFRNFRLFGFEAAKLYYYSHKM